MSSGITVITSSSELCIGIPRGGFSVTVMQVSRGQMPSVAELLIGISEVNVSENDPRDAIDLVQASLKIHARCHNTHPCSDDFAHIFVTGDSMIMSTELH